MRRRGAGCDPTAAVGRRGAHGGRHAGAAWGLALALAALMVTLAGAGDPQEDHRGHGAPSGEPAAPESAGPPSIPDVLLLNQDGEQVRFYSDLIEGRLVAINFIFTTCTTICPPMGANFARLQRLLRERPGRDIHLISVSVDPAVDTPARLKAWAAKFGAQPGWTLVTGAKPDVDGLLKALRVFTPDKNDHSPTVLVGDDARGAWTRAWGLAPPEELARAVERVTAAPGAASGGRTEGRR